MFIASIFPLWALIGTSIIVLIFFIVVSCIAIRDNSGVADSIAIGSISSIVFMLIVLFIFAAVPVSQQTFSNPHNEPNLIIYSKINKEVFNNTIAETIGADKVSIDLNDTRSPVRSMKEGNIFNFTAFDDGSKINGSFYFTEDSLEIIVENEQQVGQKYSINTNE